LKRVAKGPKEAPLPEEVSNLLLVQNNPEFIRMIEYFYWNRYCFMVLEFPGTEWECLFDYEHETRGTDDHFVRNLLRQVVNAEMILMEHNCLHGDIKGTLN
jgi:serine/threonine protein kinase